MFRSLIGVDDGNVLSTYFLIAWWTPNASPISKRANVSRFNYWKIGDEDRRNLDLVDIRW